MYCYIQHYYHVLLYKTLSSCAVIDCAHCLNCTYNDESEESECADCLEGYTRNSAGRCIGNASLILFELHKDTKVIYTIITTTNLIIHLFNVLDLACPAGCKVCTKDSVTGIISCAIGECLYPGYHQLSASCLSE